MTKVNLLTPLCTATLAVAPLAQAQELTLKAGYGIVEEHPLGQGVNRFVELIGQKTGGKLKGKGYPAMQHNKINEVQKYLSVTQHGYSPYAMVVGKNFWDKLPTDQQQAMSASCKQAGAGPVRS